MLTVSDSRGKRKELIVPVTINGKIVDMELNTRDSVAIIPKSVWTDVLASKTVERTVIKLRSYSRHERFKLRRRDQKAVLPITTGNDGPVLMGCDWLSALKLDWGQVKRIFLEPVDKLDKLRTKYSSLFDGNLGTIKGVTTHLKIKGRPFYPRVISCVRLIFISYL